ncbi:MAG: hypothetical protein LBS60_04515 [Deltaproteobacteria bacterium]|nr:hypothetical protein [Deltaproteobacteria bacterium]
MNSIYSASSAATAALWAIITTIWIAYTARAASSARANRFALNLIIVISVTIRWILSSRPTATAASHGDILGVSWGHAE